MGHVSTKKDIKSPIYVISLPQASHRRQRFLSRSSDASVRISFFDAHTDLGRGLEYSEHGALAAKGRPLAPAEIGCYSSHAAVWQAILNQGHDRAFVFEDDVVVDWNSLSEIECVPDLRGNVEYLRLYAKRPCRMDILVENIIPGRSLVDYRGYAYGTQGYLITKTGAERFLRHCRVVRRAIDDELDRSWAHGIPNLAIFPFPIFEESGASTIGSGRFDLPSVPQSKPLRARERLLRILQLFTGRGLGR